MEKRWIDANDFLAKSIEKKRFVFFKEDLLNNNYAVETVYSDLAKAIDDQPTVDAVEVVRCKDCKHLYNKMDDYRCASHRGLARISENSYCCYGERHQDD